MHLQPFISLVLALLLGYTAITGFSYYQADNLQVHDGGTKERNWKDSRDYCAALDGTWRLPSVHELYGIHLHGTLPIKTTDYWSSTSCLGYAFGVNTRSNILSFDRHSDIDHTICVKDIDPI